MTRTDRDVRCLNALESLLTFLNRSENVPCGASLLSDRFGSAAGALEAEVRLLEGMGLGRGTAQLLALMPELTRYCERQKLGQRPLLNRLPLASGYLKALFHGVPIEKFYLLCLDARGRLIDCRLLQKGTLDETPFYLGALLQCVVQTRASCVVLSHNHPGGTLHPSRADIDCTQDAIQALLSLDVCLLDHIIIADGSAVSFRMNRLIEPGQFKHPVYIHWMDAVDSVDLK